MKQEDANKLHEDFMRKFYEMTNVVDSIIADCELCCDMSLLYDFLENRTRRCDKTLTNELGELWDEKFNHYFTGD